MTAQNVKCSGKGKNQFREKYRLSYYLQILLKAFGFGIKDSGNKAAS